MKWHVAFQHFSITCSRHISETLARKSLCQSIIFFFCYLFIWPFVAPLYIVTSNLTVNLHVKLKLISNVMFGSISIINNILKFSVNMIALSLFFHCCPFPIHHVVD